MFERLTRKALYFYLVVYFAAFAICWTSLAVLLTTGGRYVSVLSWNLFAVEELYRYQLGGARAVVAPATLVPAAVLAAMLTAVAGFLRHAKQQTLSWIFLGVALLAALIWFPNPWENM